MAALTPDSPKVVRNAAARLKLTYPVLSDPELKTITTLGVSLSGSYLMAVDGNVKARYLVAEFENYTAASVLLSFSEQSKDGWREARTQHLWLRWRAVDAEAKAGGRTALLLEVSLPDKVHVYSPRVSGSYIPVRLSVDKGASLALVHPANYPRPNALRLEAINETLPVYERDFRITREVTFAGAKSFPIAVRNGKVTVEGGFRYQACDDRQCYPPVTVPLVWTFKVQ